MKIKTGIDIVNLNRFKNKIKKANILQEIFLPLELKNKEISHLAGIFAAKEATIKALGLTVSEWLKIEVQTEKSGKPILKLPQDIARKVIDYDVSISHDGNYSIATVVVLLE